MKNKKIDKSYDNFDIKETVFISETVYNLMEESIESANAENKYSSLAKLRDSKEFKIVSDKELPDNIMMYFDSEGDMFITDIG